MVGLVARVELIKTKLKNIKNASSSQTTESHMFVLHETNT